MNESRKAWKDNLSWMSPADQDAVELTVLRYLERSSGYPRPVDAVLAAVTSAIEPVRRKAGGK